MGLILYIKNTKGLLDKGVDVLLETLLPSCAQKDVVAREALHIRHAVMLTVTCPEHQAEILSLAALGTLKILKEDSWHGT